MREFPPRLAGGFGDIDSGPLLFGVSISATGFAMASARAHHDREMFTSLYRTAYLFGAPSPRGKGRRFLNGAALGNAIMLAMLTAGPGAEEGAE